MNDYVICTDSGCDLSSKTLSEWGVPYQCLSFQFDGSETIYSNTDMDEPTFYAKMRARLPKSCKHATASRLRC